MKITLNNIQYEFRPQEGGAFVITNDYQGDIVIPAQILIEGAPINVVGIAQEAFYGCDDVTSVTLSEGLTTIEDSAFENMSGLTEILIPESVKHIGRSVFGTCENLQRAVLPSQLQSIPEDMFESCGSLTDVNIPAGVKTLEPGCFAACTSLKSITLPKELETIGAMAFELCTSLEQITIPSSVKTIGGRAFNLCSNLKKISFPDSITHVGYYAFNDTAWFDHHPKGPVVIGKVFYRYLPVLTTGMEPDCILPDEVEYISKDALELIARPMRIFLPKNLKEWNTSHIMPSEHAFESYYSEVLPEGAGDDYPYDGIGNLHRATIDGVQYVLNDWGNTAEVIDLNDLSSDTIIPDKVHYGERTYSVKEPSEEKKKIAAMVSKLAATDERDSKAIDQIFDNFIKSMLSNSDSDE